MNPSDQIALLEKARLSAAAQASGDYFPLTTRQTLIRDFVIEMLANGGDKMGKIRAAEELADAVLNSKPRGRA